MKRNINIKFLLKDIKRQPIAYLAMNSHLTHTFIFIQMGFFYKVSINQISIRARTRIRSEGQQVGAEGRRDRT